MVYDHLAVGGNTSTVPSDFSIPSFPSNLPTPPKQIRNMVYWFYSTYEAIIQSSSTTTENNYAPAVSNLLSNSQTLIASFDQYCIHSFTASFLPTPTSTTSTALMVPLYTAIDYDSINNQGLSYLVQMSSSHYESLTPTTTVTRYVEPCIAVAQQGQASGGGSITQFSGVSRSWIDSAFTNVPHYGLRTILEGSPTVFSVKVLITCLVGVRNNV